MSMIQISDLTFSYDTSFDYIFEHVSFKIDTDWKLGFTGRNGRGKTTFLKLLMGEYEYRGSIAASVKFDYFPYPVKDPTALTVDVLESVDPQYELWKVMKEMSQLDVSDEVLSLYSANGLKISYVPQNTEGLKGDLKEGADRRKPV